MYRDNIRGLVGGIDGVRAVDTQCIQIAGIAFVVGVEIFTDMNMIVDQSETGVGPDSIAFHFGIDQGTVLVEVIERKKVSRFTGGAADGYVMAHHGSRLKDVFEPVVAVTVGQRNMIGIQVIVREAGIRSALWCACRR